MSRPSLSKEIGPWRSPAAGLVYRSQREDAEGRAELKAYRLRARLRDNGDLLDPLPERPPSMHHRTYQRLCDEIDAATDRAFLVV